MEIATGVEIPARPMLKPWYRVLASSDRVLLEFGGALVTLGGGAVERLVPALLPLLDGTATPDEIVARMGVAVEPAVRQALETLATVGALTEGPPLPESVPRPAAEAAALVAAASPAGQGAAATAERLARSRVGLLGDPGLCDDLSRLLAGCGVGSLEQLAAIEPGRPAGVDLVVVAGAEPELLERINAAMLASGGPWLAMLPFDGTAAWVGPFIVPGETCCWRCFRLRQAATSGYANELLALEHIPRPPLSPPPLGAMIAGLAATVALRWLASRDPMLPGTALALELWPRIALSIHVTYRVPRCPACSGLTERAAPAPWAEEDAA